MMDSLCVRACVRVCVCEGVLAWECVRACLCMCVNVHADVFECPRYIHTSVCACECLAVCVPTGNFFSRLNISVAGSMRS